jgi:hypothetical protein
MIVRNVLVLLLIIPPAIILMTTMLMSSQLRRFQRTVPVLHTADDLQRLRRLVKTQMYASLICLALLAAPLMVCGPAVRGGHRRDRADGSPRRSCAGDLGSEPHASSGARPDRASVGGPDISRLVMLPNAAAVPFANWHSWSPEVA